MICPSPLLCQPSTYKHSVQKKPNRPHRPRRLALEALEPRCTPSVDLLTNMTEEIMEQAPELMPGVSYYLGRMRSDGSFNDLNYSGSSNSSAADLQAHGKRLEVLSLAYKWNDASNLYFGDSSLRSKILQGWSYAAYKAGYVNAPNWWWKAVGVPQGMCEGLILMRSEMSATVRNQILTKYFSTDWTPSKYDGANITYQAPAAMIDGLLRGNTSRIRDVVSKVSSELSAYSGEGIQRDLSFLQHRVGGKLNWYSGSYGLVFTRDTARIMRWVDDTTYAFGTAAVDQHLRFMLDHLAWLTRGDTLEITSQGRSITRPGQITSAPYVLNHAMIDMLPLGRRTDDLLAFIDRYENGVNDHNYLAGNRSLWKGDAMVHERQSLLATVKMISSRTARPETAAGENTKGFFEGDGFTMFVQDGDEFGARGEQEIIPVWDWQRLPGTTVEHNGVIPYYDMFSTSTNSSGSSGIVGSASDGNYGVAMMDYRRSGVTVTAKKSWFFFDNEVVALGADIDDSGFAAPVFTSLNQVLLDGPVTVQDAAGRRTFGLGDTATLSGTSWVEHDGLGYVLLDPTSQPTVQAKMQTGSAGVALPVFSAWLNHGIHPQNATYAYAVVPGTTPDGLDNYAANLPITILANTPTVQAVRHNGLAQTQIAFYAAGAVWINDHTRIAVNQPALLIIREVGDDLVITAADPPQTATSLAIDVSRRLVGAGAQWLPTNQVTHITLPLPAAPYLGSSITRTYFSISGEPAQLPAEADAYVRNGTYASNNYGQSPTLTVQNYISGYSREAFLRFDTSSLGGEIVYAEVRLTAVAGTSPVTIAAAPVADDSWTENGLTWNLKPLAGTEIGRASLVQGKIATFDVTNLVRAAIASDNKFSLRIYSPSQTYYSIGLGSRENTNPAVRPVLEVFVRQPAVPLAEGESSAPGVALAWLLAPAAAPPVNSSTVVTFPLVLGPLLPTTSTAIGAAPPPSLQPTVQALFASSFKRGGATAPSGFSPLPAAAVDAALAGFFDSDI